MRIHPFPTAPTRVLLDRCRDGCSVEGISTVVRSTECSRRPDALMEIKQRCTRPDEGQQVSGPGWQLARWGFDLISPRSRWGLFNMGWIGSRQARPCGLPLCLAPAGHAAGVCLMARGGVHIRSTPYGVHGIRNSAIKVQGATATAGRCRAAPSWLLDPRMHAPIKRVFPFSSRKQEGAAAGAVWS